MASKSFVRQLSDMDRRLRRAERPPRETLVPVPVGSGVPVTASVATATHVILATGVGSAVSWTVLATLGTGTRLYLRLRDGTGATGEEVTVDEDGLVSIRLPIAADWVAGQPRVIYLDARVSSGEAIVLPLRAVSA